MSDDFVNFDLIASEIIRRATRGLNQTIKYAEGQAKHYAPVRELFGRQRQGTHVSSVHIQAHATPAQAEAVYRRRTTMDANKVELFTKSRTVQRQVTIPQRLDLAQVRKLYKQGGVEAIEQAGDILHRLNSPTQMRGGKNSEMSVIRHGKVTVAGDLRQVEGGRLVPTAAVVQLSRRKANLSTISSVNPGDFLSSRGRYEVRTGRANYKSADLATRAGGSLLHSIHRIEATPTLNGGMIWGYVEAGSDEIAYAGFQEFGTRHNRAHPFMRPALYDSRRVLVARVKSSLETGRR